MPFCSKCGAEIKDTENVCSACGQSSGVSLQSKVSDGIEELMQFFDTGEFIKLSWRWMCYHLPAVIYLLLPIALIVTAITMNIFAAPIKILIAAFIALIFLTAASIFSFLIYRNRVDNFDDVTEDFSESKVSLSNFWEFFKIAFIHSVETSVYAFGVFAAIAMFGGALASIFMAGNGGLGWYAVSGLFVGPVYGYLNIFITKIIVIFLKVVLEYLPKLIIIPIKALYNLFGIIIDTRANLWK